MNENHDVRLHELAEEYALGMLEGDELRAFEAQLAHDADLRASVASSRDALAAMGFAIPVRPDAALRDRVLTAVRPQGSAPPHASTPVVDIATRRRGFGAGTWIALTAIAASAVVITKLTYDLRDTRELAASAEVRVAQRDLEIADRDSLIAQLSDPGLESVSLTAAGARSQGVRVYVDRRRKVALLSAAQIEAVPAGQVYQLWFIVAGNPAPVPSVTFEPDSTGTAMLTGVQLPEGIIIATAVTKEPTGGSQAPTSPIVFAGSFEGR